jgi:hypothetical protein
MRGFIMKKFLLIMFCAATISQTQCGRFNKLATGLRHAATRLWIGEIGLAKRNGVTDEELNPFNFQKTVLPITKYGIHATGFCVPYAELCIDGKHDKSNKRKVEKFYSEEIVHGQYIEFIKSLSEKALKPTQKTKA